MTAIPSDRDDLGTTASSAATATSGGASAMQLFSLQVRIDHVTYEPRDSRPAASDLVLAFQFLHYDIVLIDDATFVPCDAHGGEVGPAPQRQHYTLLQGPGTPSSTIGRACLLEQEALELLKELQADPHGAFVFLLLERDALRARLVAFSAVPMSLPHVALAGDGRRHPRVSEWLSVDGAWGLRDHQDRDVGQVRGGVTLACLGSALTPHVITSSTRGMTVLSGPETAPTAGAHASHASPSTTTRETDDSDVANDDATALLSLVPSATSPSLESRTPPRASLTPTTKSPSPKDRPHVASIEVREAAIQCDHVGDDDDDRGPQSPATITIHGGRRDDTRSHDHGRRASRGSQPTHVDELDLLDLHHRRRRQWGHLRIHDRHQRRMRVDDEEDDDEEEEEGGGYHRHHVAGIDPGLLPPPLFFQKPRKTSAGRRRL